MLGKIAKYSTWTSGRMKKKVIKIVNVGRIEIDGRNLDDLKEDHCKIVKMVRDDGMDFEYDIMRINIEGMKILYADIGDMLRSFEELHNPR
jgi:hypothetical protein